MSVLGHNEPPGEDGVEVAREKLRRAALMVGEFADMDPGALYRDSRGGSEEAYWRHIWIWLVRTALDTPEADIEKALAKHHDTIAYACHRVEDMTDDAGVAEVLEWLGDRLIENFVRGQAFRSTMDAARRRARVRA